MKKFLVTGGAGFIGSHIVEALVREKNVVRVLDNFSNGKEENLKAVINKIELIRGDIRNPGTCIKATKGVDFVLHQAALRSVPRSMQYPDDYNAVNIGGTLNMLEASLKSKVKRFVFASSSSVYGDVDKFPEKEDFLCQPISPYAVTKLAAEQYCAIFSRHYGLSCVSLRYFNVFGQRQALDDEYAVVIPKFINCMLNNEPPPIYGTGRQSRDFTYVANIVDANLLAARNSRVKTGVFNIASGKDYTILELVSALNKLLGKNLKPVFLDARAGDIYKTAADLSRSRRILGYRPRVNFVDGLKITLNHQL